jgi:hypothetical protein
MIDNFSWVIRDKLAGCAIPAEAYGGSSTILGSGRASGTGVVDLYERGIRALVSLTDRARDLEPYCRAAGLDWYYYPIADFGIPHSVESFDNLINTIIDSMNRNRPVCVHCFAGIGRQIPAASSRPGNRRGSPYPLRPGYPGAGELRQTLP